MKETASPVYYRGASQLVRFTKYYYGDKIKKKRDWHGHVAGMGESRNAYDILVGEPKGRDI